MTRSVRATGLRGKQRSARPGLAPIAIAVRLAIAGSATALALAAPGIALAAGTCSHAAMSAPLQRRDLVHAGVGLAAPVDLTRVVPGEPSADAPATQAAGSAGIAPCSDADIMAGAVDAAAFDPTRVDAAADIAAQAGAVHVDDPYSASLVVSQPVDDVVVAGVGDAYAYAATATSYQFADLTVTTGGSADATADALGGNALAVGAYSASGDTATLYNYGAISATASSAGGDATAFAALDSATFSGIGLLVNGGDLAADASVAGDGQAHAIGAYVVANVASIFNDGSSSATATANGGGTAVARGARAYGMYSAISNYGDLAAVASADGGSADARGADVFGGYGATAYNAGTIHADASANGGAASAVGSYVIAQTFSAYSTNTGTIGAQASGGAAEAIGVFNVSAYIGDAVTTNTGTISAVAEGTLASYGAKEAIAFGVYDAALVYDARVYNSGSISATASATTDIDPTVGFLQSSAVGVEALNGYGYGQTAVVNSGDIHGSAITSVGFASAWGAVAKSTGLYGAVAIDNDGSIESHAHAGIGVASATAAYAASVAGITDVVNDGDLMAVASVDRGVIYVAVDYAYATGLRAISLAYGAGETTVANYGSIQAHAYAAGGITGATGVSAYGDDASVLNATGASILATGETGVFGGGFATGMDIAGLHGVDVVNNGDITVYGHAHGYSDGTHTFYGSSKALGIAATANLYGNVAVTNTGTITARSVAEDGVTFFNAGAGATGIDTYAKYDATVTNSGDIIATADSELGITGAYGVMAQGKYTSHIDNAAGGLIVATATVGSLASDDYAGRAVSFGTHMFGTDHGYTYNAGEIVSHATVTPDGGANVHPGLATAFGSSVGAYSHLQTGELINVGSIEAAASADFGYASAYAGFVYAQNDATTSNSGDIRAIAVANDGNAFAVGSYDFAQHVSVQIDCGPDGCDYANAVYTVDGGDASLDNAGQVTAAATAAGGTGASYGAVVLGAVSARISNSGDIVAATDADDANAVGSIVNSFYGHALLQNTGTISAVATGTSAEATGASLLGMQADAGNPAAAADNQGRIVAVATGDVATATGLSIVGGNGGDIALTNGGQVAAGAYGSDATAIAVALDSTGNLLLTNTGSIAAFGDGARIAISATGGAATIANQGTLVGAIRTGDGDDQLDNAAGATWFAVGTSDFGGGDDHIANHGLIAMDDATIRLGGFGSGNTFQNFGTLAVSGSANVLDMDNPYAVINNGVITFVDGVADDRLTLVGDLAGQGAIDFDVSALHGSADRLQVDGQVLDATAQTINVNLLDLPGAAHVDIPLLTSTGTLAGSFALGNVHYAPDGFLAMQFGLAHTDQAVSLGVDVTGLNATGSLAADLAPGVQSLVDAQVGTWRERMGVMPSAGTTGISPWVRVFTSSGDVDPRHAQNFGSDGSFDFHQSNHGWELGLDVQPAARLSVGLLIAKSDGAQAVDGAGNDHFDGRTFGLYATWLADDGFYLDASQRWIGIDARLRSAQAAYATQASAQAFNVEAGWRAWTTHGGFNVVPQLQYTRSEVSDIGALGNGQAQFVSAGGVSSRARIGVAIDKRIEAAGYSWTPYGSVNVVHEFDGSYGHAIDGGLLGTVETRGTAAMLELGAGVQRQQWSLTGGLKWTDGGAMQGTLGAQLTLRYGW
jgi:outer membrane autotransporter protein